MECSGAGRDRNGGHESEGWPGSPRACCGPTHHGLLLKDVRGNGLRSSMLRGYALGLVFFYTIIQTLLSKSSGGATLTLRNSRIVRTLRIFLRFFIIKVTVTE